MRNNVELFIQEPLQLVEECQFQMSAYSGEVMSYPIPADKEPVNMQGEESKYERLPVSASIAERNTSPKKILPWRRFITRL